MQGARANGLDAKIGTLTPGKEADIVMLRTDLPNTLPFNNAYGAIVTAHGHQQCRYGFHRRQGGEARAASSSASTSTGCASRRPLRAITWSASSAGRARSSTRVSQVINMTR